MLAFWLLVFFHPSLPPPHRTSIASPEFHLFESDRNKIETRQLDIIMEITGFLTFLFILMGTYPTCNSGNTFLCQPAYLESLQVHLRPSSCELETFPWYYWGKI